MIVCHPVHQPVNDTAEIIRSVNLESRIIPIAIGVAASVDAHEKDAKPKPGHSDLDARADFHTVRLEDSAPDRSLP